MSNKLKSKSKNTKDTRTSWIIYLVTGIILLLIIFVIASAVTSGNNVSEENAGVTTEEQTTSDDEYKVTVGGKDISATEYNFYYVMVYAAMINQNSELLDGMGFNSSKNVETQYYDEDNGITWGDYFKDKADFYLQQAYAYEVAAKNDKEFIASDDSYNGFISSVKKMAEDKGLSYSEYLADSFGDDMTVSKFESYAKKYYLSYDYGLYLTNTKKIDLTEDDINKFFNDNKSDYSVLNFRSYNAYYNNGDGIKYYNIHLDKKGNIVSNDNQTVLLTSDEFSITDLKIDESTGNIKTLASDASITDTYSLISKRICEDILKRINSGVEFNDAVKAYDSFTADIQEKYYSYGKETLELYYPSFAKELYSAEKGVYTVGTAEDNLSSSVFVFDDETYDENLSNFFIGLSLKYGDDSDDNFKTKEEAESAMDAYVKGLESAEDKRQYMLESFNLLNFANGNAQSYAYIYPEAEAADFTEDKKWLTSDSRMVGDYIVMKDDDDSSISLYYITRTDIANYLYTAEADLYKSKQNEISNNLIKGFDLYRAGRKDFDGCTQKNYTE